GTHGGGRGGVLRGAGQRQSRAPHAGALTRARALAAGASPLRGRAGRGPTTHARLPGRPRPRGGASARRPGPARAPAAHARVPALPGGARHRLGRGDGCRDAGRHRLDRALAEAADRTPARTARVTPGARAVEEAPRSTGPPSRGRLNPTATAGTRRAIRRKWSAHGRPQPGAGRQMAAGTHRSREGAVMTRGMRGMALVGLLAGAVALVGVGCSRDESKGPAETLGKKVDDAGKATKDAAADAAKATGDAATTAAGAAKDAAKATADAAKDAAAGAATVARAAPPTAQAAAPDPASATKGAAKDAAADAAAAARATGDAAKNTAAAAADKAGDAAAGAAKTMHDAADAARDR